MAVEDLPPARRLRKPRAAPRAGDHQLAHVGKRRDPVVRPGLGVLAPDKGPARCLQAVLVRPLDRAHERRRDPALACPHEDRLGADRHRRASAVLKADEGAALPVDRDVDVLEAGPLTEERLDRKHVLPVHREVVGHDHAAARPVRRALDMIPGVLRDVDRVRVFRGLRPCVRVADREPAHLRGGPQVGLEERGREALRVRHVVEGAQVGVCGQPAARVDLEVEEVADHALVFGPVQPLEAPRAGISVMGGLPVDHGLKRLDEGAQRGRRWPALARRRHHPGAQLPDHLLRRRRPLVRRLHDEFLQREISAQKALVVTANAVTPDHTGGIRRVGEGSHAELRERYGRSRAGRTVPRGQPQEDKPQQQNRTRTQCLHAPVP